MAYTSGRTVKSRKAQAPTTVASATRDARRLVTKHLNIPGVSVDSSMTARLDTLEPRVRTVISFTSSEVSAEASRALAEAVAELPGYDSMTWTPFHLSFTRSI